MYTGQNGGASNSLKAAKPTRRSNAIEIVDPRTGKDITEDVLNEKNAKSGESSSREAQQPQPVSNANHL